MDGELKHGAQGEVMMVGAGQWEPTARVRVKFVGLRGSVTCHVPQLWRDWPPPPLPDGFQARIPGAAAALHPRRAQARGCAQVGDAIFFAGADASAIDGETVERGKRGEVAGAASTDGQEKVAVRFPGTSKAINCLLATLSRRWPPQAAARESNQRRKRAHTAHTCLLTSTCVCYATRSCRVATRPAIVSSTAGRTTLGRTPTG